MRCILLTKFHRTSSNRFPGEKIEKILAVKKVVSLRSIESCACAMRANYQFSAAKDGREQGSNMLFF